VQDSALIREAILRLLRERGMGRSICPSEVARRLQPSEEAWRALMPEVRAAAFDLARRGVVRVTQKGREIEDGAAAKGPIRLALVKRA
jgi:DNA-binding transcriptional ArsR family regulator